ncbi:MAG: hypothetical protein EOP10_11325 [Proteobacteria bacterium]|nr:MAG: hypothetical protein EOP10_11325 [Pseudomonadota bacterium]
MKNLLLALTLNLSFVSPMFAQTSSTPAPALDRDALAAKYPGMDEGSTKPENKKILCPFHRMLERAGLYDSSKKEQSALTVSIIKIATIAQEFSCKFTSCGVVATAVSAGQLTTFTSKLAHVNLEALHKAPGVSHECGLGFAKGGSEVSDAHRAATLAKLNLQTVKEGICKEQSVKNTFAGETEVKLIFAFLGGVDRGFIDYSDVELFFHAELPKTLGSPDDIGKI